MKKLLILLLVGGTLCAENLLAQDTQQPEQPAPGSRSIWRCTTPGGTYSVAIGAMTSVSIHEYLVDNLARVHELVIDSTGSVMARFYFLESPTPATPLGVGQGTTDRVQEIVKEGVERSGQQEAVWRKVVKNYPTTTHARTVEYRVQSREELDKIHTSAEKSFRLSQGDHIKIP